MRTAQKGRGPDVEVLIEDFRAVPPGTKWVVTELAGHNLTPAITGLSDGGHDGGPCARLAVGTESMVRFRPQPNGESARDGDMKTMALPGAPRQLSLWVKGNGTQTTLTAAVGDHKIDFGALDFRTWKQVTGDIPPTADLPICLREICIDARGTGEVDTPEILIDDISVVTRAHRETSLFVAWEQLDDRPISGTDTRQLVSRLRVHNLQEAPRRLDARIEVTTSPGAGRPRRGPASSRSVPFQLDAGEGLVMTVENQLPTGVYNAQVTICDANNGETIADAAFVFPSFPADRRAQHNFVLHESALSPFVLVRNDDDRLLLFQGMEPYGLGGPSHLAYTGKQDVRIVPAGEDLSLADMSQAWMLFWFNGALGWDQVGGPYPVDIPMLVVFEHRPTTARPVGSGWEFRFGTSCDHVAIVPLYGVSHVPATSTAPWAEAIPRDVLRRCRLYAEVSREYPVGVEEAFKVDPAKGTVTIRNRFEFLSIRDDWQTRPRKIAPVEYMAALVDQVGWGAVAFDDFVRDLDMAVGQGAWAGVEDADDYTYTISSVLDYVNTVEKPKQIPEDAPMLADARRNVDLQSALWGIPPHASDPMEDLRRAGEAARLLQYLADADQRYGRVAARALAARSLVPANWMFGHNSSRDVFWASDRHMDRRATGLANANSTSNEALRALYHYLVGTDDLELIRERWQLVRSWYNAPIRLVHWGDSAYNASGGDVFGDNLNGAIAFARMAYRAGDIPAYRFACYHVAKQFLALFGVTCAYGEWVSSRRMWSVFQDPVYRPKVTHGGLVLIDAVDVVEAAGEDGVVEKRIAEATVDLRDVAFTDLRAADVGLVPSCMVQDTSDPQERFLRDHAGEARIYQLEGIPKAYAPDWFDDVYSANTKARALTQLRDTQALPSWLCQYFAPSFQPSFVWRGLLNEFPAEETRRALEQFTMSNHGTRRGRELEILLAGIEQEYGPLWGDDVPAAADRSFSPGFHRVGCTGWSPAMAAVKPAHGWPTLVWHGLEPPKQPGGNTLVPLPLCGIAPGQDRVSVDAREETPNWGMKVWSARSVKGPPVERVAPPM